MRKFLAVLMLLTLCLGFFAPKIFAVDCTADEIQIHAQECEFAFSNEKTKCLECVNKCSVWTVFGCLPVNPTGFSTVFIRFAIGIGGGIAFLMMLAGSFTVITSSGDPERLKQGKATITKAAVGLLIIIFAIFIMQLIGKELFSLPGM